MANLLETALGTLERGQYTICDPCGQPIELERLAILSETMRCVPCVRKTS